MPYLSTSNWIRKGTVRGESFLNFEEYNVAAASSRIKLDKPKLTESRVVLPTGRLFRFSSCLPSRYFVVLYDERDHRR